MMNNGLFFVTSKSLSLQDERIGGTLPSYYEMDDFSSCINTLGLEDTPSIGCMHTWSNCSIWSKLGKVLLNSHWLAQGPRCLVNFLAQNTLSDNSLVIISFLSDIIPRNRPFKFLNLLIKRSNFNMIIKEHTYHGN